MSTVPMVGEERVVYAGVSWKAYEALLETWGDRPIRMTYDNGDLEIMSPLHPHEQYGSLIGQFIEEFTVEMNIPRHSGGATTFRKRKKKRGLEPDRCYWIQNERAMRGKKEFDFRTDPPPDLAVEVDITSSSLDRMSIYASLGVPEIWRFDGSLLTINLLQKDCSYAVSEKSAALPDLPPDVVMQFLELSDELDETSLMRSFRSWIRETVLASPRTPPRKQGKPKKK